MYANFCVYDLDVQAHTSTCHVLHKVYIDTMSCLARLICLIIPTNLGGKNPMKFFFLLKVTVPVWLVTLMHAF